jgi:2',3'-cyclic-nucleotide 2'-phosphodiesterase (5'-nucleotidase family)
MKLFRNLLLTTFILWTQLAVCAPPDANASEDKNATTLEIVHVNDLHAQLLPLKDGSGGFANVAAYIKQEKAAHDGNVLAMAAGDMTVGTPVSTIYKGVPVIDLVNYMGVDVATFGNHEFDNGVEIAQKFLETAKYPIIYSTVFRAEDKTLFAPAATKIFTVHDIRVGVIGATTTESITDEKLKVSAPQKIVEKHLKELRRDCDVVILLSHLGLEEDERLASKVEGIDVIVGGHSHTVLKEPVRVGKTLIVQAGSKGQYVGRVELTLDPKTHRVKNSKGELVSIPVKGLAPDPEVDKKVKLWEDKVTARVDIEIGRCEKTLSQEKTRQLIENVLKFKFHTDFALQEDGGTRSGIKAGGITVRDIYNTCPFDDTIVIFRLTAEEIRKALKKEVSFAEEKPFYTLVTNSYAAKGLIRKLKTPGDRVQRLDDDLRQTIIDVLKAWKGVVPPSDPQSPSV